MVTVTGLKEIKARGMGIINSISYSCSNVNRCDDNSMRINNSSNIDNGTHSCSHSNINNTSTNINSNNNNSIVSECMDIGGNYISNNELIVNSDC